VPGKAESDVVEGEDETSRLEARRQPHDGPQEADVAVGLRPPLQETIVS
jgi:hypothetical protein